jgi:hypothetical protein
MSATEADQVAQLLYIGERMANICHNLSTDAVTINDNLKRSMAAVQSEWDVARLPVEKLLNKISSAPAEGESSKNPNDAGASEPVPERDATKGSQP